MEFDAFTAGIEPGGLRSKTDIKILICYILSSVNEPLSKKDISQIMQDNALANYFEIGDAIASLLKYENIREEQTDIYTICDTGRQIADNLDTTLSVSVRDKALKAAILLLARAKTERENKVVIEKIENGYNVTLHISGGETDMMKISLYVPDEKQAKLVKKHFHDSPENVYSVLLSVLTGEKNF